MRLGPTARLITCLAFLLPASAAAEQPVSSFRLDNGLELVVIEDHRAPVVTHMVWYRVGAADEPRGRSGIAHFFEHLMFKGTDEIPEGGFSRIVAENGGRGNAFTSWDYTGYVQNIAADRLELMMRLEADRMRDLVLNERVVATERDVIIEERNSRTDNDPNALFAEQMRAAVYLNHPYGLPIIGWRHEIEALGLDDALAFYERFYAPDNAIVVVAGDVEPEAVRALAETHFGPLAPSGRPPEARPQEPPHLAARHLTMRDPRVRQPYVLRHYLVPAYSAETGRETAALSVLASILGEGITSRFTEALELEAKIAVEAGAAYYSGGRDDQTFTIWGVPAEGVELATVEAALDAEIARIAADGPTGEELETIKRRRRAAEIYALDSIDSQARRYGRNLAVGRTIAEIQAWPELIEAVTAEEVREAAGRWLVLPRSVTGYLMGPEQGKAG